MIQETINTINDTICIISSDSNSNKYQHVAIARIIETGYEIPHPYFSRYISEYLLGKIKQQQTTTIPNTIHKTPSKIIPP